MKQNDISKFTSAETAIYNALIEVEKMGAHPKLTDSVVKLSSALDDLQDYLYPKI